MRLVLLRYREELPDIPALDAIAAHVELVQGDHIFGEVVPDSVLVPEFLVEGLRGGKQIGDLVIELLAPAFHRRNQSPCPQPCRR